PDKPNLGHRPGNVDTELVWRRVLAGVETLAAVVAEIRKIGQIALRERRPAFHRREHRAVPLAIPAGIADGHDVLAETYDVIGGHRLRPPRPRFFRKPFRSSSRLPLRSPVRGCCRP